MSTAESPAVPRPRLPPPGGGRILTRGALARMLAQMEAAARPRLQAEGAESGTGNALSYPEPGRDRGGQAALELRARQLRTVIPGRGRVITRAAFAKALRAFAEGLGFPLDVDGFDRVLEEPDGGLALRRPRGGDIFVFIQVERFDTLTGNVLLDVGRASWYVRATQTFTNNSLVWGDTQTLRLPDNVPPRTRTIDVTYWAYYRRPGVTGLPSAPTDPGLAWGGPVALTVEQRDQSSGALLDTFVVPIDTPDGVVRSYSTPAPSFVAQLNGVSLVEL